MLFIADAPLGDGDVKSMQRMVDSRGWKAKAIEVKDNPRALIFKTTGAEAPMLREWGAELSVGGKRVRAALTSGAIGKLKERAASAMDGTEDGKVP